MAGTIQGFGIRLIITSRMFSEQFLLSTLVPLFPCSKWQLGARVQPSTLLRRPKLGFCFDSWNHDQELDCSQKLMGKRVYPGNTYHYSPYNTSVQAQFYNNMYGAGNCLDEIDDCAARGINEICEAAVCLILGPRWFNWSFNARQLLCQFGRIYLW